MRTSSPIKPTLIVMLGIGWFLSLGNDPGDAQEAVVDSAKVATSQDDPTYLTSLREEISLFSDDDFLSPGASDDARFEQMVSHKGYQFREAEDSIPLTGGVEADSVMMHRILVPAVRINDRHAIEYLIESNGFFEDESIESVEYVELYDVARSGFSNGSLMVVHPSGRTYILKRITTEFKDIASSWNLSEHLVRSAMTRDTPAMPLMLAQVQSPTVESAAMDSSYVPEPDFPPEVDEAMARKAIMASLNDVIEDQYGIGPMKLYFEKDSLVTDFEIWDYDADSLKFKYLSRGDGITKHDLIAITSSDTLIRAYNTFLDVLVVEETQTDTVFSAQRRPRNSGVKILPGDD